MSLKYRHQFAQFVDWLVRGSRVFTLQWVRLGRGEEIGPTDHSAWTVQKEFELATLSEAYV